MSPNDSTTDGTATPKEGDQDIAQGAYEAAGFGTLYLVWSSRGITHLTLPGGKHPYSAEAGPPVHAIPAAWQRVLDDYFRGEVIEFDAIPVAPRGTEFQRQVWAALRRIPHGKVRPYSGVAADISNPRAMRAVGAANGKNPVPILVPCHRVVEQDHKLGGYSGGIEVKKMLLRLEGARLEGDEVLPGQLKLL